MPVLFQDPLYLGLRQKYHYPPYLVSGYQNFAEKIQNHPVADFRGHALSSLSEFVDSQQMQKTIGEQQTYDQVFKRVKLQNVQIKSGTEAYEAEQKVSQ